MTTQRALNPSSLRLRCGMGLLDYDTTQDLETPDETIGQHRTLNALDFGINIQHEGYNLYAIGQPGVGMQTIV
ncbi:MAG: AAA family ATPase [Gammaproteobacteria bacterium]|nr:AAA family ATPase [Gammaproteobacteria bacterium]